MTRSINRFGLASLLLMAAVGDTASASPGPGPSATDVALDNASASAPTAGEQAAARQRAAASNFLPIVRGRLPLIFVHAIRFDKVLSAMGNKDLASKFATSVGKVFDIKKGRNFGYVNEGFKPSAEDVTAAQGWIDQVGAENAKAVAAVGDKALMQNTLDSYKTRGLATAEEIAAFSAARVSTRVVAPKPGAGTPVKDGVVDGDATPQAAAGAQNSKDPAHQASAVKSGSADDLLG
jgi:hypothetical protein